MGIFDGVGLNSSVGISKETTYGTNPGSGFKYGRLISEGIKLANPWKFFPGMAGPGRRKKFGGFEKWAGDLQVEGLFEGIVPHLIKRAMGACNTTGDAASGYTHTFAMANDLDAFTAEIKKGNVPDGKVFEYNGCMVDQLTLDFAREDLLRVTAAIIAQHGYSDQTPTDPSPTFPGDYAALYHQMGTCTIAGIADINVKNIVVTINNNLDGDRFFMSRYLSKPKRKTWREVTGSGVAEFASKDIVDAFVAGTEGALSLVFTSTEQISGTSPPAYYTITLSMTASFFSDGYPVVGTEGEIELPIAFQAVGSATAEFALVMLTGESILT